MQLVDSLKVKNERVELALRALSRGWFAPISQAVWQYIYIKNRVSHLPLQDVVYMDQPFPINGLGFNFSAPHMYAMCLEKLDLQSGHTFLDIGSGTGHMTCLGGLLVGPSGSSLGLDLNQTTIDFSKANQRRALLKCSEASSGVHLLSDSERQGLEQVTFEVRNCFLEALEPKLFDRIHVGASCPRAHIAELTALLKPGGIMVLPNESEMLVLKKGMDSEITEEIIALVRYSSLTIPSASDQKLHKVQNALKRMKATISVPAPAQASTFDIRKWTQSADRNWQEQGMDSDLTVTVGTPSTAYHVHRSVFMARSDHFHAQFTSGMKDADVTTIDLPDNSPRAFELFLHYIYLDTCDFNEDDAIAEVLQLASFYQVPRLIALCEAYLRVRNSPSACTTYLNCYSY